MNMFLVFVLVAGVSALWYFLFKGGFSEGLGAGFMPRARREPPRPISPLEARERVLERAKSQHRKLAPIAGTCSSCQKKTTLPFRCKYCGGVFCDDHRLPEAHNCDGI